MTATGEVAALAAVLAAWLGTSPPDGDRSARLCRGGFGSGQHDIVEAPADDGGTRSLVEDDRWRAVVCAAACTLVGWVFGGPVLAVAGVPTGLLLSWRLGHLEPPSVAREREAVERDLPLAASLLAASAEAGLPVQAALGPVARAVGGALAARLDAVASRIALGAAPVDEWDRMAADPQLGLLGRVMARAHRSGAPVAVALARLAQDRRRERRTRLQARARSVGVRVAAPLAACFLPAFMLIGVVPTVVGGFRHLGL